MTRRVSYQAISAAGPVPGGSYVRLGPDAITTKRKQGRVALRVDLSKDQSRWLTEVAQVTGAGIDEAAVVRALVDLGMELDIDWPLLAGGSMLREAVRSSVMVRRRHGG